MSDNSKVTFTISAGVQPAALSTAATFDNMRCVCASSPSSSWPVSGSRPVWPVKNTRSPVRMACECVPIEGGAALVAILILLGICLLCHGALKFGPEPVALRFWTELLFPKLCKVAANARDLLLIEKKLACFLCEPVRIGTENTVHAVFEN